MSVWQTYMNKFGLIQLYVPSTIISYPYDPSHTYSLGFYLYKLEKNHVVHLEYSVPIYGSHSLHHLLGPTGTWVPCTCLEAKRDGGMGSEENQRALQGTSRKCMVNFLRGGWKGFFYWERTQLGGMEFRNSMSQLYREFPKCLYSNFQDPKGETTRCHVRHSISSQKDTPCQNAALNLVRKKHRTNPNWQAFYKNQQLFKNLQIIKDKKPGLSQMGGD